MFKKYSILRNFNNKEILFMFDDDKDKTILVNIFRDFLDYELSDIYFKDDNMNIIKLIGYHHPCIFKNRRLYYRFEQSDYDKYCTRYPNTSNGQLYHYLVNVYKNIYL